MAKHQQQHLRNHLQKGIRSNIPIIRRLVQSKNTTINRGARECLNQMITDLLAEKELISVQSELSNIQSIVYFIAAAIPFYLSIIMKKYNARSKRNVTIVFAVFITMQGRYHLVGASGFTILARNTRSTVI